MIQSAAVCTPCQRKTTCTNQCTRIRSEQGVILHEVIKSVSVKISQTIRRKISSPVLFLAEFPVICPWCCVWIDVDGRLQLPAASGKVSSPVSTCKDQPWGSKVTSQVSKLGNAYYSPTPSHMLGIEAMLVPVLPRSFSRLTISLKRDRIDWQH